MRTKSKRRICTFKGFSLRLQIRLFNIYFVSAPLRKTRKAELKSVPVRTHLYFCQTSEKTQNIRQGEIWVSFRECGGPVCGCGRGGHAGPDTGGGGGAGDTDGVEVTQAVQSWRWCDIMTRYEQKK